VKSSTFAIVIFLIDELACIRQVLMKMIFIFRLVRDA